MKKIICILCVLLAAMPLTACKKKGVKTVDEFVFEQVELLDTPISRTYDFYRIESDYVTRKSMNTDGHKYRLISLLLIGGTTTGRGYYYLRIEYKSDCNHAKTNEICTDCIISIYKYYYTA